MIRFVMNVYIIWFGSPFLQICSRSLECRCFAIWTASSILSTNIIVLDILLIASLLSIRKSRSLNLVLHIKLTMDVKFGRSSSYLYIRNGGKNSSETLIYSRMFGVTVADNKQIRIVENISFKYASILYSFWKFYQLQIICALSIVMQARRR